jgi:hypothetical protein
VVRRPSLRFLAYLAGRLDGMALLLVVATRTGERSEQAALLADLAHEERCEVVALQPLSQAGVADLLAERLGVVPGAEFAQACLRSTGGNPLLLDELSRALRADGIRPDAPDCARRPRTAGGVAHRPPAPGPARGRRHRARPGRRRARRGR